MVNTQFYYGLGNILNNIHSDVIVMRSFQLKIVVIGMIMKLQIVFAKLKTLS